ncbi:MAG: acyltransferase family protein [Deltaproteobacteria bacterium]|nr:acyltransferase family protein [Deltaproteobacteria bacterium]MBW2393629.1 acyltransferase family protein [Deltaproteobacteria bacterium]
MPSAVRDLQTEIADRVRKIPTHLNEFGFDAFGMHPETASSQMLTAALAYRYYFRVETFGIEKIPSGGVLLISNHAGQLPFDGMMLAVSMLLEGEPPRLVRGMGEYFIPQLPFMSWAAERGGNLVGTRENCIALLEAGECVMVFPEGVRGMNKTFDRRYKLQRFGQGFLRLALQAGTPIVPIGIVGSEEQNPGLANLESLGKLLGMPAFPITATFPLLGPLGMLPLPVKYRIHFGEPLHFEGKSTDEDEVVQRKVDRVRAAIDDLLAEGRAQREGVFR